MHLPDGFFDAGTSVAASVAAVGGLTVCARRASATMEDRDAPLAGLVAAFVFAAQMLNFPVGAGTSGHLLGGVLATVLVGPWLGTICIAVVLLVQALLFADGGLTALGLNVVNLALVGGLGGYALFLLARRLVGRGSQGVVLAASIAAGLSVVAAVGAFTLEFALGGTQAVSVRAVAVAMIGVHALIGLGEAVITGLTLASVLAVRPDLVHGARSRRPSIAVSGAPAPVGG